MGEQGALDAVVAGPDHGHPPAGEILIAAALEHDADARIARRGEHGGHAREGRDAHREHRGAGLERVTGGRRHAHAAVGELDPPDVGGVALGHEAALEPLGVAQEVLQRQRLDALALAAAHPRLERAGVVRRGEVGVLPVGAQQHVGRHQGAPRAHGLAERPDAARTRAVSGDREPEGPGADDGSVEVLHDSQPSGFLVASPDASARSRLRRRTAAHRRGERDHGRRRRARRACQRRARPHGRHGRLAARGRPLARSYFCATAALNGAGELTGTHTIEEWGYEETPVFLTATPYVGAVYAGATRVLTAREPRIGRDDVIIPVVGECDPSAWCDVREGPEPDAELVARALDAAAGAVAEGQVGAGVGMETFGYAAGIGTSSRLAGDYTVGVLVLANFGLTERLIRAAYRSASRWRARRPRAARARASASSRPTRRCSRTSSRASPGGPSSASRARARTAPTARARSPSPGRPRTCCRATAATSSTCACCATIR